MSLKIKSEKMMNLLEFTDFHMEWLQRKSCKWDSKKKKSQQRSNEVN